MTDLLNILYEYTCRQHIPGVWHDPEYRDCIRAAQLQEERRRARLDWEGFECLDRLLDELAGQYTLEQQAAFQSAFALARQLNALLHP